MPESKSPNNFVWWFKFCPNKFARYIAVSDVEAGKRFKELLSCLLSNEAPDDSIEAEMIADAKEMSRKQRERVMARWHPNETQTSPATPANVTENHPSARPPRPRIPTRAKPKQVSLQDIYDWCDTNKVPPPIGKEFFDYNELNGWKITTTWQNALAGFVKTKRRGNQ